MRARFLGCLVDGVREERNGFTIGKVYAIDYESEFMGVTRVHLLDDDGDVRYRPQDDLKWCSEPCP